MRQIMFDTIQIRFTFLSFYHFNVFQATLRISFRQTSIICLAKLQLQHFYKTFDLQLLQGSYTVKNILLNFYITEILLFLEYLKNVSKYTKLSIDRCSIKQIVISMLINVSYPELYLKMSSFANISQSITNVEQFFYKT